MAQHVRLLTGKSQINTGLDRFCFPLYSAIKLAEFDVDYVDHVDHTYNTMKPVIGTTYSDEKRNYIVHSYRSNGIVLNGLHADGKPSRQQFLFQACMDDADALHVYENPTKRIYISKCIPKNKKEEENMSAFDSPEEELVNRDGFMKQNYLTKAQKEAKREAGKECRKRAKERRDKRMAKLQRATPFFIPAMPIADYKPEKVNFPCYVQPKMDGCRIRIAAVHNPKALQKCDYFIMSQNNNVRHFWAEMKHIIIPPYVPPGCLVEGEFWSIEMSWQQIAGLFNKKTDPITIDNREHMRIVLFDCVDMDPTAPKQPYKQRLKRLQDWTPKHVEPYYKDVVQIVTNQVANNHAELDAVFKRYIQEGQEGVVIRNPNAFYNATNVRKFDAMKYKEYQDEEYKVLNVQINGDKVRVGLETADGFPFAAMWPMEKKDREALSSNPGMYKTYTGQWATVKYTTKTLNGIPRSAEVKGIRYAESAFESDADTESNLI